MCVRDIDMRVKEEGTGGEKHTHTHTHLHVVPRDTAHKESGGV